MQITRQRIRPVAVKDIQEVCPTCGGTGKIEPTVLLEKSIENQLSLLAEEHGERYVNLVVSPYVAAYIKQGLFSLRNRWAMRYGMWIKITASQAAGIVDVKYLDGKGENMLDPNYIGHRKVKKVEPQQPERKDKERKGSGNRSKRRVKKTSETKDKE